MMKNLLKKELTLALHPTAPIFLALSAMLLIPSYPYLVAFFYTGLAVFFMCLNGRENNDVQFSMLMPVAKRDVVRARFTVVVGLQVLQVLLAIPFALLRQSLPPEGNSAGMDANAALFGCALVMYGGFNLIFMCGYYEDVSKVGVPFLKANVWILIWIGVVEVSVFTVPFVRDRLDTTAVEFLPERLIVLAVGIVVSAVLTWLAYRRSVVLLEKQDL